MSCKGKNYLLLVKSDKLNGAKLRKCSKNNLPLAILWPQNTIICVKYCLRYALSLHTQARKVEVVYI